MVADRRPVAVVLAGGRARRMGGGDKALVQLGGRPLLRHVLDRVGPQVRALAVSANGDPARFAAFGVPVLADPLPDTPGPLAGILAGMRWAARVHPDCGALLSVPTDTPFLPADLAARLLAAATPSWPLACAVSLGRRHPVVAVWPVSLADDLAAALAGGERVVERFAARHGLADAMFLAEAVDPFFNVNEMAGLEAAERMLM